MKLRHDSPTAVLLRVALALGGVVLTYSAQADNLVHNGSFADDWVLSDSDWPWNRFADGSWDPFDPLSVVGEPDGTEIIPHWTLSGNFFYEGRVETYFDSYSETFVTDWLKDPPLLHFTRASSGADGDGSSIQVTSGHVDRSLPEDKWVDPGMAYLSQKIPTSMGSTYTVCFWLQMAPADPRFQVWWGSSLVPLYDLWVDPDAIDDGSGNRIDPDSGAPLPPLPPEFEDDFPAGPGSFGWRHITLSAVADTTLTELKFGFEHESEWWGLDDVQVYEPSVAVPEGGAMRAFLSFGLIGLAGFRQRN